MPPALAPVEPPRWLSDLRRRAADRLKGEPEPPAHSSHWRRTKLSSWGVERWAGSAPELSAPGGRPAARNGTSPAGEPPFIRTSLAEAARLHPNQVRPYLEEDWAEPDFARLELANQASWGEGSFLCVPRGVKATVPVEILFRSEPFPRSLIVVEPEAELCVVETHAPAAPLSPQSASPGSPYPQAAFSRLVVGEGASVRFFYLQELGPGAVHFWHQKCTLARDAQLSHTSVALGGRLHKANLSVELEGPGARSELFGLFAGDGDRTFDIFTRQHHLCGRTSSDLLYQSVLKGSSRLIYNGLIRIEKGAGETGAYQANRNLLLSPQARADSTPILEILTDSVHCKHGATAGPPDPDELFYLQSRGLDPSEAERTVILGFFEPVLKRLPLTSARERLLKRLGFEAGEEGA